MQVAAAGHSSKIPTARYIVLNAAQLKEIAKVGGVGMGGLGQLKGKLMNRDGKRFLVTYGEGSRSQVAFQLGKGVAPKMSKRSGIVTVQGVIHKTSPWGGTITNPNVRA